MKKMRRVLLFSMGLALVALIGLCGAVAAPQDQPASELLTAVAGQPSLSGHEDDSSCSCACSPLAGAWVARLSPEEDGKVVNTADGTEDLADKGKDDKDKDKDKDNKDKKIKRILQTYKFAPVNARCDKFVVNAQALTRPQSVIYAFPEVTDLTELVGIACQTESCEIDFTVIGYGLERTDEVDKTVLIAVVSGTIELPKEDGKNEDDDGKNEDDDGKKDGKDSKDDADHRECDEPEELYAELTAAYFDANQDKDGDGFPDSGEKPVICLSYEATFKRVELKPQCKPTKESAVTAALGVLE